MAKKAEVEMVENGFLVTVEGVAPSPGRVAWLRKFIARDEGELAAVFGDLWHAAAEASAEVGISPDEIPGVVRGSELEGEALAPDPAPEVAAPAGGGRVDGEVVRAPVADDGTEYPVVRQLGPNHFEVECPVHGSKRMERRGTNWSCAGGSVQKPCQVSVPRGVIGRLVAAR